MSIPFTQFLRPNGRPAAVSIDRPDDIEAKAELILSRGYRFECEELMTGHVSFTVSDDEDDHDIEVCANGPAVPEAIDRLVTRFSSRLEAAS